MSRILRAFIACEPIRTTQHYRLQVAELARRDCPTPGSTLEHHSTAWCAGTVGDRSTMTGSTVGGTAAALISSSLGNPSKSSASNLTTASSSATAAARAFSKRRAAQVQYPWQSSTCFPGWGRIVWASALTNVACRDFNSAVSSTRCGPCCSWRRLCWTSAWRRDWKLRRMNPRLTRWLLGTTSRHCTDGVPLALQHSNPCLFLQLVDLPSASSTLLPTTGIRYHKSSWQEIHPDRSPHSHNNVWKSCWSWAAQNERRETGRWMNDWKNTEPMTDKTQNESQNTEQVKEHRLK